MIRVMLFTLSLRKGGAEGQIVNLAKWLTQSGLKVSVATVFPDKTSFHDELLASNIPVFTDWFTGPLGYLRGVFRLANYLRHEHIQIVHTYLMPAYLFSFAAAILAGIPARIASERSTLRPIWPRKRAWLYHILLRWTPVLEINAEATRQILVEDEGIQPQKIVVHRNAIPLERFDPLPTPPSESWFSSEHIRIGTVANIHPYKNLMLLAGAAAALRRDYPQVDTIHVGRNFSELTRIELERFGVEHLDGHWIMLGGRDDVPAVLQTFDIYVSTSNFEGMSNSVLEAMASGLPIISTDTGDIREVLNDSGGGIVVPLSDQKALVGALRELLDDPEQRQRMGRANRAWVFANCHPARLTQQVVTMYKSLLNDGKG